MGCKAWSVLAAKTDAAGLDHGRRLPPTPTTPSAHSSPTWVDTLQRSAVKRQRNARERRSSCSHVATPPPSPSVNAPIFGRRKIKGSKAWDKLFYRHLGHSEWEDQLVPVTDISKSANYAIDTAYQEITELD